jgi:hypothetical protein
LKYNLRTVRAYLQREDFQRFWEYRSPYWAVYSDNYFSPATTMTTITNPQL